MIPFLINRQSSKWKIWIYWYKANSWNYFYVLNKNWKKNYWFEQSFTDLDLGHRTSAHHKDWIVNRCCYLYVYDKHLIPNLVSKLVIVPFEACVWGGGHILSFKQFLVKYNEVGIAQACLNVPFEVCVCLGRGGDIMSFQQLNIMK
jgi:hypothetical protein